MSGTPSEAEVQTQWQNAVAILESLRAWADGTLAGGGGLLDDLLQDLEGEYTPPGLTGAAQRFRAGVSQLLEQGRALEFLSPIVFEYGRLVDEGGGNTSLVGLMRALYEHFVANTLTVESRAITFDAAATLGAGNVGNGACERLTVDENNFPIEFVHVETKQLRCIADQNSGAQENAEVFEILGAAGGQDALLRHSFGSGVRSRRNLRSKHAGTGQGGSLLRNSSFDIYSASATPSKFAQWTETTGGANITQHTANFYRTNPGATVDGSLRINGGAGTVTLKQTLANMRISALDPEVPYFLRVMVNKTVGTAVGGTFTIRLGSVAVNTTIAAMGANWVEIMVPVGQNCWPRNFNEDPFDIEIEWSSSTSGYLLVDDVIFVQWDEVDATYWCIRGNAATHTPWLLDDKLEFTDTGGAPATGKIQWWLFVAGLGYLPSSATPSLADP